jgi:hypothetical protein
MRPDVDVVDEDDVEAVEAEPEEGLLDRTHRAIVGIVDDRAVRQAADKVRAVAARSSGTHPAPDLARNEEAVARHAPQRGPESVLGKPMPV